jgi:HK97 family phage prohead protease
VCTACGENGRRSQLAGARPSPLLERRNVKIQRKDFGLKIKAVDEAGKFTGIGAVYNNVDLGGDKILPGAFSRTLAAGKPVPLLWQHQTDCPIGSVTVKDTPQGLAVEGQLLMSDSTAQKAYSFLKAGIIKGLSIGFETMKSDLVDGVRELQELKLWELSVVTFPMNEEAMVTGIKAMSDDDRGEHLKAIDTHRKAIDRHQRGIREHLKAMSDAFDDDTDDDEALLQDEGDDEDTTKALLVEMQKLVEQARELA